MFKITVDGLDDFAKRIREEATQIAKNKTREIAEAVRCPVHNETGKVTFNEDPRGTFRVDVEGCCSALGAEVTRVLTTELKS